MSQGMEKILDCVYWALRVMHVTKQAEHEEIKLPPPPSSSAFVMYHQYFNINGLASFGVGMLAANGMKLKIRNANLSLL
jgi:hypothetical protein